MKVFNENTELVFLDAISSTSSLIQVVAIQKCSSKIFLILRVLCMGENLLANIRNIHG